MTVSVNSENRATTIKNEIGKALRGEVKYQLTSLDTYENSADMASFVDEDEMTFHEKAMQDPKIREQVANMFFEYWKEWVDYPLPALGGKTPRDAVATEDGREKVEALLRHVVSQHGPDASLQSQGIEYARKELEI